MKKKTIFWVATISFTLVFLYLVKSILLPFVVGIMVAYFFDPLADRLEKRGLSRMTATLLITCSFFLLFLLFLALLMPLLFHQLEALIQTVPKLVNEHQEKLVPKVTYWLHAIDPEISQKINEGISNASAAILGMVGDFVTGLMQSSLALINLLSLFFVTPVVAFYFLRDWDKMVARFYSMLPRRHAATIKQQLHLIDKTLSGFIRGQTRVCMLLGTFYAIGLSLVGLEGGLLIGFFTGLATFVPYVGMLVGTVIGLAVAWFQFESLQGVLLVAGVFTLGQIIESNFVTPNLVGDKVGLHPVWIIFGMLAGGTLFGFLGVLLAVPVTAVMGVLIRFLIEQYRESAYYKK